MRHCNPVSLGGTSEFMIVVLMGVSGCGKSTVGKMLADRLGWRFYEGDDFHTAGNVEKMSSGIALSDDDRLPWLAHIRKELEACSRNGSHAVLACSALRESYRTVLTDGLSDVRFVYLKGEIDVIRERMSSRRGHYMKARMLDSQLASLEEPELAIVADITSTPQDIVTHVVRELGPVTPERQ